MLKIFHSLSSNAKSLVKAIIVGEIISTIVIIIGLALGLICKNTNITNIMCLIGIIGYILF